MRWSMLGGLLGSYARVPVLSITYCFEMLRKSSRRGRSFTKAAAMKKFKALKGEETEETFTQIILQVLFPYLIAGLGMIGAGAVLNHVKHWDSFLHISEVVILIPSLLGLKGNLEMTLAARLSTQANLGAMDTSKGFWCLATGNVALTLCQAVVVGFLASMLAICLSLPQKGQIVVSHALLLTSSCMMTAFLSSIFLGSFMCVVVYLSRKFHINPDNVATPVAGSLGDLMAISMLATIFQCFYGYIDSYWLNLLVIIVLCSSLPVWWHISSRNNYSQDALHNGWYPIIGAMTISSFGGMILDNTLVHFDGIARFQPLINGIGGNLVAIQVSRLSTTLHRIGPMGTDISTLYKDRNSSWKGSFCHHKLCSKSAQALLMLVIPGHFVFLLFIWAAHKDDTVFLQQTQNISFAMFYLSAAFIQVALLLHIAYSLVIWQWGRCLDPDTSSIPYLTAIGDFLGIILLATAFYLHILFGENPPGM